MLRQLKITRNCKIYANKGNPVDIDRDVQVRAALGEGYDWLFFLDSDVIPPDDVIDTLSSHRLPIVSGLYTAKQAVQLVWSVWMDALEPETERECFVPVLDWQNNRMFKVEGVVGTGCLLVHRKVFETIQEKYPDLPFFYWTKDRDQKVFKNMEFPNPRMKNVSEDFWFCLLARACGFDIIVDSSVKCSHISQIDLYDLKMKIPGT